MPILKKFEFLEHTADVYIAAYGEDLANAFENAALALFETMTNIVDVSPKVEDSVEASGRDESELLYNWLEALVVKFDVDGMLFSKFKIEYLDETIGRLKLKGRIWGEKFNPSKHLQKVGVKAVTYSRMEILKQLGKVEVKFVIDI